MFARFWILLDIGYRRKEILIYAFRIVEKKRWELRETFKVFEKCRLTNSRFWRKSRQFHFFEIEFLKFLFFGFTHTPDWNFLFRTGRHRPVILSVFFEHQDIIQQK